jgi:subtilisin family serine protease
MEVRMQKTSFYKWLLLLGLFAALALANSRFEPVAASQAQLSNPPINQVAVKLKSGSINTILTRYNATQIGFISETNLYILQLCSGQTADQMLPTLNADTDLWYAELNYYTETSPDSTGMGIRGTGMGIRGTGMGIRGTGEVTPTPPGGIPWEWIKTGLTDAKKISSGQGVIVAVLDTGLAADHPLLQSNITTGYDFVKMTGTFLDAGNGLDDDGDGLVDEYFGHGTHVAGIIVTYAPGVQIMPIRVLNSDGIGTYWEVSQGIRYAVDHGAKVINMSLTAPYLTSSLSDALAYAASHSVIVVAAAGNDDPGPNYPAGYSDPLAVIGVGASDQNDSKASFSGGLASDTDVFAPGVDIYSSYRYNGFGLGTGTSMASPIVAAEAAMLIARHPDWSAAEVEQRILTKGAAVPGSSAKRVDLAGALNTGPEVDHGSIDTSASPTDEYLLPRLRLFNNTPFDIPYSELKMRYWYTADSYQPQIFMCDYTSSLGGCPNNPNLTGTFVTLPSNSPNKTSLSDTYLEVGFNPSAGNLVAGSQLQMYLRVFKSGAYNFTETNDYSYDPSRPDMARWNRITVYRNGVLVWGIEPTSSSILTATPTRTATAAVVSTATPLAVGSGTYDDPSSAFFYSGSGWSHGGCSPNCYQGTNSWNSATNDYITVTFNGTQFQFYGVKDPAHGIGAVSIDGGAETNIDFYAATRAGDQLLWTSPTLTNGIHTFKLRVTGTKNASSSNTFIVPDAVIVGAGGGPTFTPTKTSTAAPNTATRTNTPVAPANTNTPTKTLTAAAPTATYTKTSTPVAPTATVPAAPTATASAGGLKVKLEKDPTSSDTNASSPFYILISNTGASPISGITARVYFTIDGSYTASQYVLDKYYDQSGSTVQGPTLLSGSTYYYTINAGTNSLAAGATWQINFALHLSDWSNNLNATNDWWHTSGALPTTFTDWTYLPAYINSARVWGVEPP